MMDFYKGELKNKSQSLYHHGIKQKTFRNILTPIDIRNSWSFKHCLCFRL